jgi:iron complex outermembrane receptor protein
LSRTFHSFGIKVLQDGIPINYADGFFDMQTIDPSAARYVEVIRGANALGYGASTLGGAINYVSPTGYDSPKFLGRAEAGSFGYARLQGITGGVVKPTDGNGNVWDYNISANAITQDGYRNHSAQDNQKFVGNFGVKLNSDLESRTYIGVVRSRSQLPGYLTKDQIRNNPTLSNNSSWPDSFQRRDVDAYRLANKTVYTKGDYVMEFAAYTLKNELWHPISIGVPNLFITQSTDTYGGHLKLINNAKIFGLKNQLTIAYLPEIGKTNGSTGFGFTFDPPANSPVSTQFSQNHRFMIEEKINLSEKTVLITSLQYDQARRKLVDSASSGFDRTFSSWIPRLGFIQNITATSQVFGNISKNFEAPIFGITNNMPATKAQTGTTIELGARGDFNFLANSSSLIWDATIYRSQLKNEFQTICNNAVVLCSVGDNVTVNVPKTIHQGLELGVSGLIDRQWETRTALLYSDFRFDGDAQYGNNRLPGFPPLIIRSELLYRWSDISNSRGMPAYYAGPKLEWVPTKAPMDNTNSVSNDPYAIIGFKAGGPLDQKSTWFIDARNLADKRYAATTNIGAGFVGGNPGQAYYPGMGRSINIGLETKW